MGLIYWVFVAVFFIGAIAVIVSFAQRDARQKSGISERGALVCPFCSSVLADNVLYLGQQVNCPKCGSSFNAPNYL